MKHDHAENLCPAGLPGHLYSSFRIEDEILPPTTASTHRVELPGVGGSYLLDITVDDTTRVILRYRLRVAPATKPKLILM
jgi:hypothetical protein